MQCSQGFQISVIWEWNKLKLAFHSYFVSESTFSIDYEIVNFHIHLNLPINRGNWKWIKIPCASGW